MQNDGELIWRLARDQVMLTVLETVRRVGSQIGRAIQDELVWWNLDREGKRARFGKGGSATGDPDFERGELIREESTRHVGVRLVSRCRRTRLSDLIVASCLPPIASA